QPADPYPAEDGRVVLGPAMRADLLIDMDGKPGRTYQVVDDYYGGLSFKLLDLAYALDPPQQSRRDGPPNLLANPLPEPDLAAAERHEIALQGGMMGGMSMMQNGEMMGSGGMMGMMHGMGMMGGSGSIWAMNGASMAGDGQSNMPPLLTLKRGQSCLLALRNE